MARFTFAVLLLPITIINFAYAMPEPSGKKGGRPGEEVPLGNLTLTVDETSVEAQNLTIADDKENNGNNAKMSAPTSPPIVSVPSKDNCVDGTSKKVECNTCTCSGGIWACTLMSCGGFASLPPPPSSECEQICTMEYKPVCDNTGRTHSNKCAFENVACKDLLQRFIVREGACDDGGSSDDVVLDDVAVDAVAGNLERYPIGPYPNVNRPIVNQRPSAVCRARYSYHPSKADWEGARQICEMEGGQLAVITDERSQGRIGSRFGKLDEFWIGATDIEREGQFRWVNGQGLGFARWYSSQPNKKYPNNEHCVTFNYWGKDTKWGDRNCYDSRPFLCETMVCQPTRRRFPNGYPGQYRGPLRNPYQFPRNANFPGPRGFDGIGVQNWPRGRGFPYNSFQRIDTTLNV